MKEIKISIDGKKEIKVSKRICAYDILSEFGENDDEIIAVKINNETCSLTQVIDINCTLKPIYLKTHEGSAIYRRTLCFVLAAAAQELFPAKRLLVGHSLGYGYYYTFDSDFVLQQKDLENLEKHMRKLIYADHIIKQSYISYNDAIELFEKLNLTETRKQLNYICPPKVPINTLGDFCDLYFAPLLVSTGILKLFELKLYQGGFLLRFPMTAKPDEISDFEDLPQLFSVYDRYKTWGKQLNVSSCASLNALIHERKQKEFIDIVETFQNKTIADIADQIHEREGIRVILIAGPSSSGKTTTSKKLSMQLRALGYTPQIIELDTYYVGRDKTPLDENGDYDYECLEALDVEQLNQDLVALFNGKTIDLPSYDFKDGKRFYTGKQMQLCKEDILILEGIHGLNDRLTPLLPNDIKFKIYLSALTQLNLDDHNRISTSDNRLIRRIVRDSQFRGKTAVDTIKMWPSVQRGEKLHIYPFQGNADAMLNTALDYELAVLKMYAEPLLRAVNPNQVEYSEASRLLRFLSNFLPIPSNLVPGQSLIREFIGGSDFKY